MNYVLKEKDIKGGTYTYESELEGLEIKPRKDNEMVSVKKIIICDEEISTNHVKKIFEKKINHLMRLILTVLNTDSSDDDATMVLDEISKFKSVVINKYKESITTKFYKDTMKKLIIMEEEFKTNYIMNSYYVEPTIGRSR